MKLHPWKSILQCFLAFMLLVFSYILYWFCSYNNKYFFFIIECWGRSAGFENDISILKYMNFEWKSIIICGWQNLFLPFFVKKWYFFSKIVAPSKRFIDFFHHILAENPHTIYYDISNWNWTACCFLNLNFLPKRHNLNKLANTLGDEISEHSFSYETNWVFLIRAVVCVLENTQNSSSVNFGILPLFF